MILYPYVQQMSNKGIVGYLKNFYLTKPEAEFIIENDKILYLELHYTGKRIVNETGGFAYDHYAW